MNTETTRVNYSPIDVEKAFASKDPKLLKRIPGFFIRYLKRIVHQEEINDFLHENNGKEGLELINAATEFMHTNLIVKNLEKLPKDGRFIFAANHPIGGPDGLWLMKTIFENTNYYVKSVSNDLLMNVEPMRPVFIGVNKHGGNAKSYVAEMQQDFEGDTAVIFFPAGLVSRRIKGKITDLEWKSTFIKKAVQYERDVIPVHISGRVSGFFYRLANLRKFLGIRYNIEMLYLVNEMFKQRNKELTITFGDPLPWQTFDKSKKPVEWTQYVRERVYEMGK